MSWAKASAQQSELSLYFDYPSQPSRACVNTSLFIGLDINLKQLSIVTGENRKPPYLAINPLGFVPCLKDGDFILAESASILRYLCNSKGAPDFLYPRADYK